MNSGKKLYDICDIIPGYAFKSQDFNSGDCKVIKIADIKEIINCEELGNVDADADDEKLSKYKVQNGDFIMSMTSATQIGKIGRITNCNSTTYLNQRLCKFIPKTDDINKMYIYYAISQKEFNTFIRNSADSKSLQQNISHYTIGEFPVNIPEKPLQNQIVNTLLAIDNKIEVNNIINTKLEQLIEKIFEYWFLQFDFPDDSGKPYRSSGGKMMYNDKLKMEIPIDWHDGKLIDYIGMEKGGDWGKDTEEGNYKVKVSCIRGADFPAVIGKQALGAPERYILEKNMSKILDDGDVVVEISGGSPVQSTGRVCYINSQLLDRFNAEVITSNFCKAFSMKNTNTTYWFYVLWKKIYDNGILFNYESKTTGIKNLLFDILVNEYPIISPNSRLIKSFNEKVEPMFAMIQHNNKENQKLSTQRNDLIPLLINGQVGFKNKED